MDAGATVTTSVVGPGAQVGGGATVERSVLLPGAVIGRDAVVEDSVVAGTIGPAATVVRVVVGADAKIADREHVHDARVPAE